MSYKRALTTIALAFARAAFMPLYRMIAAVALATALLSACGGGGDGGGNTAPVAQAATPKSVVMGGVATLDGSASSDANGDPLSYAWTLTSRPAGSAAVLSGSTTAKPTFTADVAGTYVATLVVSDSKVNSAATTITTTAAAAGDLRQDFGAGGKVTTDLTGATGYDEATAMLTLENGKTIAVGFACTQADDPNIQSPINDTCDFALTRYKEDGSLDLSFGSGGKVTTDFGAGTDARAFAAAGHDGKIIVAGRVADPVTGNRTFALARYNSDGSLDTSFGSGGLVTTPFPLGNFAAAEALAVHDHKIIAVGTAGVSYDPDPLLGGIIGANFALARYNEDGSLDSSFGSGGLVTTDFSGDSTDEGSAVLLQDDKIVVAGFSQAATAGNEDFALARYNADGSLDATFGSGGLVVTDFFGDFDVIEKIAQQGNKIVAVGITVDPAAGTQEDFALARYNYDGSLDATFGTGGKVVTDFRGGFDLATGVDVKDGKIVVSGVSAVPDVTDAEDFALARYNEDGSLDTIFGAGGLVITDFAGQNEHAAAVRITCDRIIVVGATFSPDTGEDFALAAYQTCPAEQQGAASVSRERAASVPRVGAGAPAGHSGSRNRRDAAHSHMSHVTRR